jgi:hypothetical protein
MSLRPALALAPGGAISLRFQRRTPVPNAGEIRADIVAQRRVRQIAGQKGKGG